MNPNLREAIVSERASLQADVAAMRRAVRPS